jgi:hypothetical protein
MKAFIAGLMLLAGSASTPAVQSHSSPLASFSIVVTAIPNGWAARCDSGCQWRAASFKCADACDANVDANGLVTVSTPRTEPTAFSFRLAHTSDGVRAKSQIGTAWKTLTWSCSAEPCDARIDAHGVSGNTLQRVHITNVAVDKHFWIARCARTV